MIEVKTLSEINLCTLITVSMKTALYEEIYESTESTKIGKTY